MESGLRELSLLGIGKAALETLCQIGFLQVMRGTEKLETVQWQVTKILRDVEHIVIESQNGLD